MSFADLREHDRATTAGWDRPMIIGLAGLLFALLVVARVLAPADWDPSATVAFGMDDHRTLAYAQEHLDQVLVREAYGHDGKFFFIQANDPLLLSPEDHAVHLDQPTYRAQRMLYPLLASLGGLLGPEAILWGLIVTNVLAVGAGTAALSAYSVRLGLTPWLGMAFPLNPGVISEIGIDGGGTLAFALLCVAVAAVVWKKPLFVIIAVTLAVLTREVMLLAPVGLAFWYWRRRNRRMVLAMVVPVLAALSWAAYLRLRLPPAEGGPAAFDWPMAGVLRASSAWFDDPVHLVSGLVVVLVIILFVVQIMRGRRDPLAFATFGFAGLSIVLSSRVWGAAFDMSRAVLPIFTAVIVNPRYGFLRQRVNSTGVDEVR